MDPAAPSLASLRTFIPALALLLAACQGEQGKQGEQGPPGPPGPASEAFAPPLRVVVGQNGVAACASGEVMVTLLCRSGVTGTVSTVAGVDAARCQAPGVDTPAGTVTVTCMLQAD